MSYQEAYKLPIHKRRFLLNNLVNEVEKRNEAYEEAKNEAKGGKQVMTGDKLKSYIKNNGNPT